MGSAGTPPINHAWQARFFRAMVTRRGKTVRCSKRDAHRELGLERLQAAVRARGFHLLECGEHYVIICDSRRVEMHF